MTIAELQDEHSQYRQHLHDANSRQEANQVYQMLESCSNALGHVDGALKFAKRKLDGDMDFFPIKAICKTAPVLFEHTLLLRLQEIIISTRMLAKHDRFDFPGLVADALEMECAAQVIWSVMEALPLAAEPDLRKATGISKSRLKAVISSWRKFRIIRTVQAEALTVSFETRMSAAALAICPQCSTTVKSTKERFCQEIACPKCGAKRFFHIVPE